MFVLEYKEPYIVPEPLTKNRTCQSYRWKQYAIADDRETLQKIIDSKKRPENWHIEEMPSNRSISEIEAEFKAGTKKEMTK